jgi:hypothetical protein
VIHHLELWRDDATEAGGPWPWLLAALGYSRTSTWPTGQTWEPPGGGGYVVLESGPDHRRGPTDRVASGMNHVAFRGGTRAAVDALAAAAADHGWTPMFAERYPHAGGPDHYAAYLEDASGFEVEIVADT